MVRIWLFGTAHWRAKAKKGLVDLVRFELTTSSMPWKRAPNCATGPIPVLLATSLTRSPVRQHRCSAWICQELEQKAAERKLVTQAKKVLQSLHGAALKRKIGHQLEAINRKTRRLVTEVARDLSLH